MDRAATSGRCTAVLDDGLGACDFVTLTQSGCTMAADPAKQADEESLPVAVIAGAVGGGGAAFLLFGVVVFLVLRSRGRNKQERIPANSGIQRASSAPEMSTTREEYSGSGGNGNALYGDIRLTNVYSIAGLSTQPSTTTSASGGSGDDGHYSPMAMSK